MARWSFTSILVSALVVAGCSTQTHHVSQKSLSDTHTDARHGEHQGDMNHESGMGTMDHMAHMNTTKHDPLQYTDRDHSVTQTTEKGNYRVTLFSNQTPIPIQEIHTWTVHVEDMQGKPYEGRIFVNGGMPMHRHSFPTKPRSNTYLGDGDYRVEGVKFNMQGHWEIRFNIRMERNQSDRVVFKVRLRPDSVQANHQWNEGELATIRSLWIENLATDKTSTSNRVANNADAAKFGQQLFFDTRFSANGQVSCASCHKPELYFTDGLKTAQGIGIVKRNAPTVVGANFHTWFFHDGRADSLWSQALGPMEDRQEHGGNRTQYAHIIYSDPGYRSSYEKLFDPMPNMSDKSRFPPEAGPVKDKQLLGAWNSMSENDRKAVTLVFVNMAKTIAAYERLLKPAPARFDYYVKAIMDQDKNKMTQLMSAEEVAGLKLFISKANCTLCHNGPLLTDLSFHNIGTPPRSVKQYDWGRYKAVRKVKKSEFNCRGEYNDADNKQCPELDYIVFHKEETAAAFKTPSLRNVSKTAPYMHAGQYKTLSDVMQHYAEPPGTKVGMSDLLPVELNKTELAQLEAFLLTLDSPVDADPKLLKAPD